MPDNLKTILAEWHPINTAAERPHYHCPFNCEHPQPFLSLDGQLLCGRCASHGILTEVIPCTPETCPEDHRDPQVPAQ